MTRPTQEPGVPTPESFPSTGRFISLYPDTTMQTLLAAAKAFSELTRVRVILALRGRELCVCELCDGLGVGQSTLSTHLQLLRQTGLVQTRQEGKWIYYALTKPFARVAKAFLHLFEGEIGSDEMLRADDARLTTRLRQRDDGACCVGFSKPKRSPRPARVSRDALVKA